MRAFIAIDLPKEVKDELYKIQKEIGSDLAKIRWIAKKNLHLTLKFFKEISEKEVAQVKSALKAMHFKPFKVYLNNLGFFPNEYHINVIWIGLEPVKPVMDLQSEIDERLSDLFKRENKFEVHLSLGRVKFVKDKEKFLERLKEIKVPKLSFEINNFKLVESKLTKDGPVYTVLENFISK